MRYVYLVSFIAGLLLTVRLMFFGAERRRVRANSDLPLRWSEPLGVAFLVVFGVAGYAVIRRTSLTPAMGALSAAAIAAAGSLLATWLAVLMARMQPEHDPDDPRFVLQGQVGMVTVNIPADEEGEIRYDTGSGFTTVRARAIDDASLQVGEEVCIERIEDGIAHVERWSVVQARL